MKLVIMAGGYGTRLRPYTEIIPKILLSYRGKSMLEVIIERYKPEKTYIIARHKHALIKNYVMMLDINAGVIVETEELGTAGGLSLLPEDEYLLTNCDIIYDGDIEGFISLCKKENATLGLISFQKTIPIHYGVLDFDSTGELIGMREKPELKIWCNAGIYYITPDIIKSIRGKKNMDEVIFDSLNTGNNITVYPIAEEEYHDIGTFENLRKELGYEIF